jgi:hypothetical protein
MKTITQKHLTLLTAFVLFCSTALAQPLDISFTTSDFNGFGVSCFTSRDGWITVTATGGTPPYTYAWSNGASTATISDLSTSYYAVVVTDDIGTVIEGGLNLTAPEPLNVELVSPEYPNGYNVSCYQCFNGSISNSPGGGVTPYSYTWDDGPTTQNRTSVGKGLYSVVLADANSCSIKVDITLTEPERSDWTMTGNTGSNPSTNYIGTTDNNDLVMKSNNSERVRLASNGSIKLTPYNNQSDLTDRLSQVLVGASGNLVILPFPFDVPAPPSSPCIGDIWHYNVCQTVTLNSVGIGTYQIPTGYYLAVNGKIITTELKVQDHSNWPDYVLAPDYKLMSPYELDNFIRKYGHLPGFPSAKEVKRNGGFEVGKVSIGLLKTAEVNTLHIINQQKQLDEQKQQIEELKKEINELKMQLKK